jgi:hypothetical protein
VQKSTREEHIRWQIRALVFVIGTWILKKRKKGKREKEKAEKRKEKKNEDYCPFDLFLVIL